MAQAHISPSHETGELAEGFGTNVEISDRRKQMPHAEFLSEFESNPDKFTRMGWDVDFPVFSHKEIRILLGEKGKHFGRGIRTKYYFCKKERELVGGVYFDYNCEGPYGKAHGGAIATALDSLLGACVMRSCGFSFVTISLNVKYHKFVKLGKVMRLKSKVTNREGKKVFMEASICSPNGKVCHAHAEGVFLFVGFTWAFSSVSKGFDTNEPVPWETAVEWSQGVSRDDFIQMIVASRRAKL